MEHGGTEISPSVHHEGQEQVEAELEQEGCRETGWEAKDEKRDQSHAKRRQTVTAWGQVENRIGPYDSPGLAGI